MMVFSKSSQICQVVIIGTRSPKWQWLNDRQRKGKSPHKGNKGKLLNPEVRAFRKQTCPLPGQPLFAKQIGGGGGDKTHKKRKPKWIWASPAGVAHLQHLRDGLSYQVKLSCNTGPIISNLCGKREPRKLHTLHISNTKSTYL